MTGSRWEWTVELEPCGTLRGEIPLSHSALGPTEGRERQVEGRRVQTHIHSHLVQAGTAQNQRGKWCCRALIDVRVKRVRSTTTENVREARGGKNLNTHPLL